MVKRVAIALLLGAASLRAETFKLFGSAGAEQQLTPPNAASSLNPGNVARIPYRTSSGDATAFVDASPESRAWKLHVKLHADALEGGREQMTLGEAFVRIAPRPWLDLTAGRVIEKWGTGYAWNPVAFVSPRKNPADPTDRRSSYRGVDMLRADVFVRDTNVSLYALSHGSAAMRVYRLVRGTDLSLYVRRDRDGMQQGVSVARVFGDALELHGEVARRHALAGGQYTFRGNVNVVAEIYHGGDGLDARQWSDFRLAVDGAYDERTLRAANAAYAPLRMARNYGFVRIAVPVRKLDTELIAIANLRDGSLLARGTLSYRIRPNVALYVIDTEFAGGRASELAYMQVRRVTTGGARLYF